MKYKVVTYGDPSLREKAEPIADPTDVADLISDMLETLHSENGLGLAAEQVGKAVALCIVDIPPAYDVEVEDGPRMNPDIEMPMIMINPEITEGFGEDVSQEGCLSFPEIFVPIKRAAEVQCTYTDQNGKKHDIRAKGLAARAVQHEIDHLNGVLIVDRMSVVKKVALAGKLKRIRKSSQA
jgi:peptide deformylase